MKVINDKLLEGLSITHRLIMENLYGLKDGEQKSLKAVGISLQLNEARVRQIEIGTLMKIASRGCMYCRSTLLLPKRGEEIRRMPHLGFCSEECKEKEIEKQKMREALR